MIPTFLGMAIYAGVAIVVGLLVLKYARWRPEPTRPSALTNPPPRGFGCSIVLLVGFLIIVAIVGFLWLFMGGRH